MADLAIEEAKKKPKPLKDYRWSTFLDSSGESASPVQKLFTYIGNHEVMLAAAAMVYMRNWRSHKIQWGLILAAILVEHLAGGSRSGRCRCLPWDGRRRWSSPAVTPRRDRRKSARPLPKFLWCRRCGASKMDGMRLATLKAGGRDGTLVVVSDDHTRFVPAGIPTLQDALGLSGIQAAGLNSSIYGEGDLHC